MCLLQSSLSVDKSEQGIIMSGTYYLNCHYNDVPLFDEYEIKILIPWEFPLSLPSVWETGNKIPRETAFGHFLDDGRLCLGASCDLISCVTQEPTISHYICTLLDSYLYSSSYFIKYGMTPDFGERSHGLKGLIEAYKERYDVSDERLLTILLFYLAKLQPYRGHLQCPCCSGKKFRECHGKKVLEDILSPHYPLMYNDAVAILTYYYKEEKKHTNEQAR